MRKWVQCIIVTVVMLLGLRYILDYYESLTAQNYIVVVIFICVPVMLICAPITAKSSINIPLIPLMRRKKPLVTDQVRSILNDECDPPRYIYELTHPKESTAAYRDAFLANDLMSGYLANGEIDRAEDILLQALADETLQGLVLSVLHYNLAGVYLRKGNLELASPHIEQFKNNYFVEQKGLAWRLQGKKRQQENYNLLLNWIEARTALINSDYTKALELFQGFLERSNNNYGRVYNHYCLAFIYGKLGDSVRQRSYLSYAAQYGNQTFEAKHARALLEKYAETEGCIDFYCVSI